MSASTPGTTSPLMLNTLGLLGKLLNIASVYGTKHPSIQPALRETYDALTQSLLAEGKVILGNFHKKLTINDKMITDYTAHLRALERRLVSLNTPHLIIENGLEKDELLRLTEILMSPANKFEKTLKEIIDEASLDHIKAEVVEYVAQHEGERIVGEDEGFGRGEGGTDKEGQVGDEKFESKAKVHVEQIMAFLKGDLSKKETPDKELQEMLSDPEKLGQLIMESVEVRQTAQALDGGESLADIVIGCLRRTYDGLSEQRKYKSARGKASLNNAMLLLEKTVVDKIRNAVGEDQPEVDEQILQALREAEEQRQVEILAARYAEQRKKITRAELDILEHIREHGAEKARALLTHIDMPEHEWDQMVIQARLDGKGFGPGAGPDAGGVQGSGNQIDMGALAIVLDKLETIMDLDDVPPDIVRSAVEEVRENVQDVRSQFEREIEQIEEDLVRHEAEYRKAPDRPENKQKRGDILLDISQLALKLAQPLTVISASVDGVMQQALPLELQKDLLEMARESTEEMKTLMARLTKLVGYPSMQEADKNLSLYQ
jgi:hypothetical protein